MDLEGKENLEKTATSQKNAQAQDDLPKIPEGQKAPVAHINVDNDEPQDLDLFPRDSMKLKPINSMEYMKKMSTIRDSVKRMNSGALPSIEEVSITDINVDDKNGKVTVTMPWQKTVPVSVVESAVSKAVAASIDIDLQNSTLKGKVLDGRNLSPDPNCTIVIENGSIEVHEIKGLKGKSKLSELDILTGSEGCSLIGCKLTMEACSVIGKGSLFITSGADVAMVDCEVTEANENGVVVAGSTLHAKRTKFVEHGLNGVEAKDKSSIKFEQCDFIGSRKAAGLSVAGKGSVGHVLKTTFINNELSSIMVSNGADVKVEDCVCFNSQTGSGLEAAGKGTKVQLLQCEFLNSHLHGVHAVSGAHISADGTMCRGSVGCGLVAEGPGSRIQAVACVFADNSLNGTAFANRAVANLRGCTISGSKTGYGVEIGGHGTDVTLISCKIVRNNSSGVMVQGKALGALRDCESLDSKTGCGLEVDGEGTEVWVTRGSYDDNPEGGVIVNEGRVVS